VITYPQTLQTVLVGVILQPRVKKCLISSAERREAVSDGEPRSSGVLSLVGASDDTVVRVLVSGRLAEEDANGEAVDSLDDSCLSTLSKSKSSPICESESSGCRGRGRGRVVRLHNVSAACWPCLSCLRCPEP
jgi:hypothetical protein